MTKVDLVRLKERWKDADATTIIREARYDIFGTRLLMGSHFNSESALMLDLVTQVDPRIPVIYIDDPETRDAAPTLAARFNLNLHLFNQNGRTKAETLYAALVELGAEAVLHGIRGYHDDVRKKEVIELGEDGIYRINPVVNWTREEVERYLVERALPHEIRAGKLPTCDLHRYRPVT